MAERALDVLVTLNDAEQEIVRLRAALAMSEGALSEARAALREAHGPRCVCVHCEAHVAPFLTPHQGEANA